MSKTISCVVPRIDIETKTVKLTLYYRIKSGGGWKCLAILKRLLQLDEHHLLSLKLLITLTDWWDTRKQTKKESCVFIMELYANYKNTNMCVKGETWLTSRLKKTSKLY